MNLWYNMDVFKGGRTMLDKIIIYLTEKKLQLKKFKEEVSDKWYDVTYSADLVKGEVNQKYNKYLKSKVDSVKEYFINIFKDLDSASTPLYNLIWYRSENRFFGYIMALETLIVTGFLKMAGLPQNILLLSLLPVSIIPIDIITTTVLFIYNRFKRAYNNSLKRMKKEYNVRNDKDLVELYKKQKEKPKEKEVKQTEVKKEEAKSEKSIPHEEYMSDSDFIERLFGFVDNSKYIDSKYRESYLIEVESVINSYSESKKRKTDRDLKANIDFLQGEYDRYLRNTQTEQTTNTRSYPVRTMKK